MKHDLPTAGGIQEVNFITEGDMYRLITHSKLPDAEKFERWVFDEILPTIRKHGAYMTDQTLEKALTNPDFLIQLATQLKTEQEQRRKLETTVAVQEQQIAELQPKASYYDVVLNCKDLLSITSIAKDYGKSGTWLNNHLHEKGVQYKQGKIWLLYQKYAEKGYTSTKTQTFPGNDGQQHTNIHTYWTIEKDGEPWFVGKDVADILGYTNTAKAIRDHVDDEDKLTKRIVLLEKYKI